MAERPVQFVSDRGQLQRLCARLERVDRFGLDTEFVTEETFYPALCLVQIALPQQVFLVDPLAIKDLGALWQVLSGGCGQMVVHSAEAEIGFCRRAAGSVWRPIFDVQIAAGLAGYGYPLSYQTLVYRVLGQRIGNTETRTEWRRRPLTERQVQYAAEDVRYLLPLQERLGGELERAGRMSWAEEEFERLRRPGPQRPYPWWPVRGTRSLSARQRAVLQELAKWRYREAQRRDKPLRSIASDDLLRELARRQPTSVGELLMLRGMNRRRLRRAARPLQAIERGRSLPDEQLPPPPTRPPDSEQVRMLTALLGTALAHLCAEHKLPPSLVATTADLTGLVRAFLAGERPGPDTPLSSGWRHRLCGQLLLELLQGRRCLRVHDAAAELPLTIDPAPGQQQP